MHTYVGTKKTINGYGLLLIDMKRGLSTSLLATEAPRQARDFGLIPKNNLAEKIATDHWKPYEAFVPKSQHIQSKSQTFTVEGYNSLFRHFLARLRRKTKCYSKMSYMLELSILLLMHYRNNTLAILN